jgi:hypothetical protein
VLHAAESVYTEYADPRHDEWNTIREALRTVSLDEFERVTGKSRRMLIDARKGRRRPHARNRQLLAGIAPAVRQVAVVPLPLGSGKERILGVGRRCARYSGMYDSSVDAAEIPCEPEP